MKIQVPTDLNDITLGQYQRYMEANKDGADQEFLLFKTIEIFCDIDMKTVSQFPLDDAQDIANEIHAVLDQTSKFDRHFTLNGVEYGFIPDMSAMTIGEYIDLESGMADSKEFHKAAAVMYRPVTKRFRDLYAVESYNASSEYIARAKDFPMGAVSAAFVFFYNIANDLLQVSPAYFGKEVQTTISTILEKRNSGKNTGGSTASTIFAEVAQQIINEQLK